MKNIKNWVWLLAFGSLWGIMEVIGGEAFFKNNVPHASVWLSAWAFFIMGVARGVINKPGTSTAVGATAALFKLVNASPYYCHLLGIFFLGMVFDIAATLWMKNEKKYSLRTGLAGIVSAYGGYALFAIVITYLIRYRPWVAGGTPKVLHHIFIGGSFAALAAIVLIPLGLIIGINGEAASERSPRWAAAGAFVALVVLWTLGRIIG
jgi:hypothetical protein